MIKCLRIVSILVVAISLSAASKTEADLRARLAQSEAALDTAIHGKYVAQIALVAATKERNTIKHKLVSMGVQQADDTDLRNVKETEERSEVINSVRDARSEAADDNQKALAARDTSEARQIELLRMTKQSNDSANNAFIATVTVLIAAILGPWWKSRLDGQRHSEIAREVGAVQKTMGDVVTQTNGVTAALVKAEREKAFAEGLKQGMENKAQS
jgi:hypothetical protein